MFNATNTDNNALMNTNLNATCNGTEEPENSTLHIDK